MCNFTDKLEEYGLVGYGFYELNGTPLRLEHIITAKLEFPDFRRNQMAGNYNNVFYELLLNDFGISVDNPIVFIQKMGFEKYADKFSSIAFYNACLRKNRDHDVFYFNQRSFTDEHYHNAFKLYCEDNSKCNIFAESEMIYLFDEQKGFSHFRQLLENKCSKLFYDLYTNEYSKLESLFEVLTAEIKVATESIVSKEFI